MRAFAIKWENDTAPLLFTIAWDEEEAWRKYFEIHPELSKHKPKDRVLRRAVEVEIREVPASGEVGK